ESGYEESAAEAAAPLCGNPQPEVAETFSRSIALDVRRMAARRCDDRQALSVELEGCLQQMRSAMVRNGAGGMPERALRTVVNAAATVRMTDLSVTPRELRSILGLNSAAEAAS